MKLDPLAVVEVLEELGIKEDVWRRSDEHYTGRLTASDRDEDTKALARLYAARCTEEMQRRAAPPAKATPAPPAEVAPPAPEPKAEAAKPEVKIELPEP